MDPDLEVLVTEVAAFAIWDPTATLMATSRREPVPHIIAQQVKDGVKSAAQRAALTKRRRAAARTAVQTRKWRKASKDARVHEAASKVAFETYWRKNGWQVAFFDSPSGSPLTGIIDAITFRLNPKNRDVLVIRLVQLKSGKAGVSAREVARLEKAISDADIGWLIAEFDGTDLHVQQRAVL